jgi:UDP-N-acetylglucosamine diphosphorylase / glucose-1-phosphate thymidylyltransferase / UDP-N-acetylgalactosamine diphosphorylase / glucosamine-1-phosphate N-acetyltransferase / galactosamine-1-phosphate N-acetyltransferase
MDVLDYKKLLDITAFAHKDLFVIKQYCWEPLQNLQSYLTQYSLGNIESEIPPNCFIENRNLVSIGKNCKIEPFSYIKGPCIIGDNCEIRHSCYIRENVVVGNGVVIGHSTEIKNSILLNNAKAAHFAYIGDSILGNNVNIGAGVKCANFKLKRSSIVLYIDGKAIDTGLMKLGSIIGDNSQIGCNSVANPGTIIGKNCICYPNIVIKGFISENSYVKTSV